MKKYNVFEHNGYIKVIPEAFNWWAFLFGFLYFLYKGMIKWAVIYILIGLFMLAIIKSIFSGYPGSISSWDYTGSLILGVIAGKGANSFMADDLISNGFKRIGTVDAINDDEAKEQAAKLLKK